MAADDSRRVRHFDDWYAAMATSPRRDEIVQRHLGLPAAVLSGSLLPWDGIAEVVELLRLPVPATLVDLACGRGGYGLEVAARTGASLIGVDFSVEAIRRASQSANTLGRDARFVVADIAATGLPTASVDGVMCIDAIHIVAEPAGVFAELRRVLRPGGRAVVSSWEARDRDNDALPEWVCRVDCAAWFAARGSPRSPWSSARRGSRRNGRCGPKRHSSIRPATTPSRRCATRPSGSCRMSRPHAGCSHRPLRRTVQVRREQGTVGRARPATTGTTATDRPPMTAARVHVPRHRRSVDAQLSSVRRSDALVRPPRGAGWRPAPDRPGVGPF